MSYIHPAAVAHRRDLYTRHDAWRVAPEAKMPGWLDPSATRVRLKEAQEEEARAEFEAQVRALRESHERARQLAPALPQVRLQPRPAARRTGKMDEWCQRWKRSRKSAQDAEGVAARRSFRPSRETGQRQVSSAARAVRTSNS